MTLEMRTLTSPLELRAGDSGRTIGGYAVVFNSETTIGDMFRERFMPGAFAAALGGDIRALIGHDSKAVIGRTKSKTLRLREDSRGLAVEIDLPDTQSARDLIASMERGDIDGMSFGFRATKQEWDDSSEIPLRSVLAAELFEVSVVSNPAYPDTSIALRSLDESRKEQKRKNFNAAAHRLRMKTTLDLRSRSKA